MALYSEKVMDHFENPRNVGKMPDADGIGEVGNAKCGDIMRMYIKVNDGIISDVKFNTFGCGSAIASSSMATEMIKGKPISEALALSNKAVVEALDGLPAQKIHCSVLAEEAVKAAVKDYYDKNGIAYDAALFAEHDCGCFLYVRKKHPRRFPGNPAGAWCVSNRCCFAWALVGSGCPTPCRARQTL